MTTMWQCLDCGAYMSNSEGLSPIHFVVEQEDGSYEPAGCSKCGSLRFRPILNQLPPEDLEFLETV